jgi:outer membrane protein assembly factor BamB
VFVCTSNGQDWTHVNVPSPNSPSFIALNKNTGELLGEDNCGIGPRIFHGQWSSPSAGQVNGQWQVYFGGGDGVLYALDPTPVKEGEANYIKKVWWFDCVPPEYKVKDGKPIKYPSPEGPSEVNATPVFYKNRVYVAIGQDPEHGEGVGHLVCVDATRTGDVTKTGTIWSFKGIKRSLSTVSIDPATGLLFIGDFSGFVYCLDAETGKVYWVHDLKAHMWGSTLVADGKVYAGDEDGDFTVFAAAKEKRVLSETNLGAPICSTPIVANGVLYVGTYTHLFAFYEAGLATVDRNQPAQVAIDSKKQ